MAVTADIPASGQAAGRLRGAPAPLTEAETRVLAALRRAGFPATEAQLAERLPELGHDVQLEVLHDLLERGLVVIYWGLTRDGVAATPDPVSSTGGISEQLRAAREDRRRPPV